MIVPSDVGTTPSPEAAFAALGDEPRVSIPLDLGRHDGALTLTELRDAVGLRQGGRFNYHLDQLVEHFVAKTDEGYTLGQPGRAVVEAIHAGAVTRDPTVTPRGVDFDCRRCGAPIEVSCGSNRD